MINIKITDRCCQLIRRVYSFECHKKKHPTSNCYRETLYLYQEHLLLRSNLIGHSLNLYCISIHLTQPFVYWMSTICWQLLLESNKNSAMKLVFYQWNYIFPLFNFLEDFLIHSTSMGISEHLSVVRWVKHSNCDLNLCIELFSSLIFR